MEDLNVIDARFEGILGIIQYNDNSKLLVEPLMPYGPGTDVDDLLSLVLYQDQKLEAFLMNQPTQYARPKDIGFWSAGAVTQQQFCTRWDMAIGYVSADTDDPLYALLQGYGQRRKEELAEGKCKAYEKEIPFMEKIDF